MTIKFNSRYVSWFSKYKTFWKSKLYAFEYGKDSSRKCLSCQVKNEYIKVILRGSCEILVSDSTTNERKITLWIWLITDKEWATTTRDLYHWNIIDYALFICRSVLDGSVLEEIELDFSFIRKLRCLVHTVSPRGF